MHEQTVRQKDKNTDGHVSGYSETRLEGLGPSVRTPPLTSAEAVATPTERHEPKRVGDRKRRT